MPVTELPRVEFSFITLLMTHLPSAEFHIPDSPVANNSHQYYLLHNRSVRRNRYYYVGNTFIWLVPVVDFRANSEIGYIETMILIIVLSLTVALASSDRPQCDVSAPLPKEDHAIDWSEVLYCIRNIHRIELSNGLNVYSCAAIFDSTTAFGTKQWQPRMPYPWIMLA